MFQNHTLRDYTNMNPPTIHPPMAQNPLVGLSLLIIEASRWHSDSPHSVRLLSTSDRPCEENYICQQTTLTRDIHASGGIRTHNPSMRAAADPCRRPRGHRDRRYKTSNSKLNQNQVSRKRGRTYWWLDSISQACVYDRHYIQNRTCKTRE